MGVLPRECFVHFIKQDYHYLKYYARAYGLLLAKSRSYAMITSAASTIQNVLREVSTMHKVFCKEWSITSEELESSPESPATTAYGAYLLDVGLHGDDSKLLVALAACLLGYGEVGLWIKAEAAAEDTWVTLEGNPYLRWIEDYSGRDYQNAVKQGIEILEEIVIKDPPSTLRLAQFKEVWNKCTSLEKGFWDMALTLT
ncbi:heme oxygenase-like protein [Rickenella mellea]|uniref:Heme oxygenase-like protein n=1 Tax=Rickenella mellea TaxID=50990 RepID=A0A4Y7PT12_9AGAM|nr:heme oxygenase-like protein [Rickenella mellea]